MTVDNQGPWLATILEERDDYKRRAMFAEDQNLVLEKELRLANEQAAHAQEELEALRERFCSGNLFALALKREAAEIELEKLKALHWEDAEMCLRAGLLEGAAIAYVGSNVGASAYAVADSIIEYAYTNGSDALYASAKGEG